MTCKKSEVEREKNIEEKCNLRDLWVDIKKSYIIGHWSPRKRGQGDEGKNHIQTNNG